MSESDPPEDEEAVAKRLKARAALAEECAAIRRKTPPGPRRLAEDLVREGRDER